MSVQMIGYDLNRPRGEADYPELIDAIKRKYPTYWHHLDSTWLVKTSESSKSIRDLLRRYIDDGDELLVAKLDGEAAWAGFGEQASKWLKDNL
jgi:hypothetical protein